MNATIKLMELVHVDNLNPDQLMEKDLIKVDEGIVEVIDIDSDGQGSIYYITYQNEYGEKDLAVFNYTDLVPLYVFIEDNE